MKKCNMCDGTGEGYREEIYTTAEECHWCDGTGKVREGSNNGEHVLFIALVLIILTLIFLL